ncbi:hypothetical protein GE543_17430 [Pseudomonas sp. SZ57]|nr:hypothetical protein [Pseudomonas sp. SZ57]POP74938.1 hypothetical protein CXB37_16630 [Pseudomonas syringae pv. syringae]
MLWLTGLRCIAEAAEDAERPERHTHAEHGYDGVLAYTYRFSRSSVEMHAAPYIHESCGSELAREEAGTDSRK